MLVVLLVLLPAVLVLVVAALLVQELVVEVPAVEQVQDHYIVKRRYSFPSQFV